MSRPDDIPLGPMSRGEILQSFATARDFPFEALLAAAGAPGKIADTVLRLTERAAVGETLSEEDGNVFFWGHHVLAEVGDTRLAAPLLRLLRRPHEEVEWLLGDAVTASLPRVVAAVYDGAWAALADALFDPEVDGFVRWSLFGAATALVASGRVERGVFRELLERFDDTRPVDSSDDGWHGWADAITLLGFADLFPRIEAGFSDSRMMDTIGSLEEYQHQLDEALARPEDLTRLAPAGLGAFSTAVEELDWVASFEEDDDISGEPGSAEVPYVNPYRDVGRNDPCPCGSGKKFKKCCMETEQ